MSTFLLSTILASMLGVAIMIIYVIDKIQSIEKHARRAPGGAEPPATVDQRFAGFEGERLWQALTGMQVEGLDAQAMDELRTCYAPVLLRHVGELLEEGVLDGRQGIQVRPNEFRTIKTTHGQVLSWIPPEDARMIYDLGLDRLRGGHDSLPGIRARLDETCDRLFASLGLNPAQSASRVLLPATEPAPAAAAVLAEIPTAAPAAVGTIASTEISPAFLGTIDADGSQNTVPIAQHLRPAPVEPQ